MLASVYKFWYVEIAQYILLSSAGSVADLFINLGQQITFCLKAHFLIYRTKFWNEYLVK